MTLLFSESNSDSENNNVTDLIIYRDVRCWGQIHLYGEDEGVPQFIRKLGIDALVDFRWNADIIALYNKYPKLSIGDLLLRQGLLCGIGNIYRSEILHRSRISPFRLPGDITSFEWETFNISRTIVLKEAIAAGGSSIANFESPLGEKGEAQKYHRVYSKQGLLCSTCKTSLIKVEILTKRKVFFCPTCQS